MIRVIITFCLISIMKFAYAQETQLDENTPLKQSSLSLIQDASIELEGETAVVGKGPLTQNMTNSLPILPTNEQSSQEGILERIKTIQDKDKKSNDELKISHLTEMTSLPEDEDGEVYINPFINFHYQSSATYCLYAKDIFKSTFVLLGAVNVGLLACIYGLKGQPIEEPLIITALIVQALSIFCERMYTYASKETPARNKLAAALRKRVKKRENAENMV